MSVNGRRRYLERDGPELGCCLSCGDSGLRSFYSVQKIPVLLNQLAPTRAAALQAATGDLELAFCPGCGFIQNVVFDPTLISYTIDYEASQTHSPRFVAFIQGLARELSERHEIRGKTVLEIGCGKGEFLSLLWELGGCRGIGIDPACPQPERLDGAIRLITDVYGPRYRHLEAELVCCRHTLEHLAQARAFLDLLRSCLDGSVVTVFFEVPDTARILAEGAFWDIYYEHCSYFTLGSLGRMFQSCGFELLDLRTAFQDQYLLLEARPGSGGLPPPDDRAAVSRLVRSFEIRLARQRTEWRALLEGARRDGRRVALWGAGSKGVTFLNALRAAEAIDCVVDINPMKCNLFIPGTGHRVQAPQALRAHPPDLVVLMNPAYLSEVRQRLAELGIWPEIRAP